HPNVLKVTESGLYDSRPYFAMEFLEGRILKDEIEHWSKLPPTQRYELVEKILIQIAQALHHIHQLGWTHRDVTPSNIMVLKNKSIKLMDFGVVKIPGAELTMAGEVIGTVAYISPEQIRGGHIDARADLYSLGGVLYLMLAGRRPFQSKTAAGFLERHLNKQPKALKHHAPLIPKHLDNACMRLLEKDADNRFASAQHLLFVLKAHKANPDDKIFVGHTRSFSIVVEHIARLHDNHGGLIWVDGPTGSGITSFLKHIRLFSKRQSFFASYNQGRTYKESAYQGLRALFESLPEALQAQIYAPDPPSKWMLFAKIRDELVSRGPSVIILDNIHLSDSGTVELVSYLIRNTLSERHAPILFLIGTHTEMDSSEINGILTGQSTNVEPTQLLLSPLSIAAVEEWLLHLCEYDERVPYLAGRIHEESKGNPALIEEMLKGLRNKNIIASDYGPLQIPIQHIQGTALPLPHSVRDAIIIRFKALSKEAQELAFLIALSRRELSEDVLNDAIQQLQSQTGILIDLQHTIEQLIQFGIVQQIGSNQSQYEVKSGWLRDFIVEQIPAEGLGLRHCIMGNAFENAFQHNLSAVIEHLAHHFECGENYGKAYPYLIEAADKLKNRTMMNDSMRYLERALSIESVARTQIPILKANKQLARVLLERGRIAFILGNWELAMTQIRSAEQYASKLGDSELLCTIYSERCHQIRERLSLDEREKYCSQTLKLASKVGHPKFRIMPHYEYGAICWERGEEVQAQFHFQETMQLASSLQDSKGEMLGHNGLGVLAMCQGNSAEARKNFEQSVILGKNSGLFERLVNPRTNLAELHHCMGNFKKSFDLVNEGIAECREIGYRNGLGVYLRYRVMLLTDLGRFVEADETASFAVQILQDLDHKTEEFATMVNLLRALMPTGHLPRIKELVDSLLDSAESYDIEGYAPIIQIWKARLLWTTGYYNEAEELLNSLNDTPLPNLKHQAIRFYLNIGRAWLLFKSHEQAYAVASKALTMSDDSGYRFYAMRARQILARCSTDKEEANRHSRIALALLRSLSANLGEEYRKSFLERNDALK
ncbi:MAG: protein kinase, partial [Myxococcota bacterium]|nr:protein kinase [Myxococcota bacterium]